MVETKCIEKTNQQTRYITENKPSYEKQETSKYIHSNT